MNKKNFFFQSLTYLIYLYPLLLILGPVINNFTQILMCVVGFYLIISCKINIFNYEKKVTYPLIFLLFYSIVMTAINENYYFIKNASLFLKVILFFIILDYLIKKNFFNTKSFVYCNLLILLVVLFDTLFQFKFGYNILGYTIEPVNQIRLTSFFKNEYVVGGFIAKIYLPVLVGTYFLFNKNKYKNTIFLIFSLSINITIFLSGERASLIISFISLIFLFIFIKELRKILFIKFFMSILIISLILLLSPKLNDRYIKETLNHSLKVGNANDNNIYNSHYGALFLSSIEIYKKNILFGNGLRSYRKIACNPEENKIIIKKIQDKTNHAQFLCSTHPHNIILEFLVDLGLIGLMFFLYIFFNTIKNLYMISKMNNNYTINKNITIAFGIQLLAIIWPINTHGSFFSTWNASFFIWNFCIFYSLLFLLNTNLQSTKQNQIKK